jgi:hypothetical protein
VKTAAPLKTTDPLFKVGSLSNAVSTHVANNTLDAPIGAQNTFAAGKNGLCEGMWLGKMKAAWKNFRSGASSELVGEYVQHQQAANGRRSIKNLGINPDLVNERRRKAPTWSANSACLNAMCAPAPERLLSKKQKENRR